MSQLDSNQSVTSSHKSLSKIFEKFNQPCVECGTIEDLTRHHLKDMTGRKTGVITILCRSCHDNAEKKYRSLGIIQTNKLSLTPNEKLQLDYINGKIPFYPTQLTERRNR